jgi:hypothetical protein
MSIDVLLPANTDVNAALAHARKKAKAAGFIVVDTLPDAPQKPSITLALHTFSDLNWGEKKPRYIEAWTEGYDLETVYSTAGIIRFNMRGASTDAFVSMTKLTKLCVGLGTKYKAWIFDSYRAQLHNPTSLDGWPPDRNNVESIVRIVGVTSKDRPSHIRTMGFERLGLPELHIAPIVPESDLQDARYLLSMAATTYWKLGGVTREGHLVIDMTSLSKTWKPSNGTGTFDFEARWQRDPHGDKQVIELSLPGSRDPAAFSEALHRFLVARPE